VAFVAAVVVAMPAVAADGGAPPEAPSGAGGPGVDTARVVYVQGDSLSLGMAPSLRRLLPGYQLRVSARAGRTLAQGLAAMRTRSRTLPNTLVVGLGTNDDVDRPAAFEASARRLLELAGPRRCVLWIDLYRRPGRRTGPGFGPLNRILVRLRSRSPGLVLVHWSRLAARHPAWFSRDAIHPRDAGYLALARAVAGDFRRCRVPARAGLLSGAPDGGGPSSA